MRNKIILVLVFIFGIIIISFNLIFFLTPLKWDLSGSSFWVIYAFSMLVFCTSFCCNLLFFFKETKKEKFVYLNILRSSNISFFIQLFISVLFLIVGSFFTIQYWIPLVIEIVFISIFIILVCIKMLYSSYIFKHDIGIKVDSSFVLSLRKELKGLCLKNKSPDLIKPLERLYEKSCFIDPISNAKRYEIDNEILAGLNKLENAILTGSSKNALDWIDKLNSLFIERSNS